MEFYRALFMKAIDIGQAGPASAVCVCSFARSRIVAWSFFPIIPDGTATTHADARSQAHRRTGVSVHGANRM